jgi:glutaredoxin-related protein
MSGKIDIEADLLVSLLSEDNDKIEELRNKNIDINIDKLIVNIQNNFNLYFEKYTDEIYKKSRETIDLYDLFFAIFLKDYGKVKELVNVLVKKKIDIDTKIRFSVINFNIFLKLRNSSIKYEEFLDVPILFYAINCGDKEIVEILLNNGVNTSLKYPSFGSLLDYAIEINNNEIIELF